MQLVSIIIFFFLIYVLGKQREHRDRTTRAKVRKRLFEKPTYSINSIFEEQVPTIDHNLMFMSAESKRAYLSSREWKEKRAIALFFADHKCQHCSSTSNLQCHHLEYSLLGNEPISHLAILCRDCHNELHEIAADIYENGYGRENLYPLNLLNKKEI